MSMSIRNLGNLALLWTLVLTGSTTEFSDEMLRALYPSLDVYRDRYAQAAAAAVAAGVLLPHDADRMVANI